MRASLTNIFVAVTLFTAGMVVSPLIHFDPFSDSYRPLAAPQGALATRAEDHADSAAVATPDKSEYSTFLARAMTTSTVQGAAAGDTKMAADPPTLGPEPQRQVGNDTPPDPRIEAEQTARAEAIRTKLRGAPYTHAYTIDEFSNDIATLPKVISDQLVVEAAQMLNDKILDYRRFSQQSAR